MSIQVTAEGKTWDWPYQHDDGVVYLKDLEDHYLVGLDCRFFLPDEIDVKYYEGELIVHCRHTAVKDRFTPAKEHTGHHHVSTSRTVTRSYRLPENVDSTTLKSHLTASGTLIITAEKKKQQM